MLGFLKTLKNRGRKFVFGNRGRWEESGEKRKMIGDQKRKLLGKIKNRLGLALFGQRSTKNPNGTRKNARTFLGRGKNWIERRLGLNRSRNNTARNAAARAAWEAEVDAAERGEAEALFPVRRRGLVLTGDYPSPPSLTPPLYPSEDEGIPAPVPLRARLGWSPNFRPPLPLGPPPPRRSSKRR